MAAPSVTSATVEGVKVKEYEASALPVTVNLNGAASGSPTAWEWSILPDNSASTNEGGVPAAASDLLSGTHGDFTNGISTTLASSITLSAYGAYKFSLRAQNAEGWSDPTYYGDRKNCECIVRIKTPAGTKRVAGNEFRYEDVLNEILDTLEEQSLAQLPATPTDKTLQTVNYTESQAASSWVPVLSDGASTELTVSIDVEDSDLVLVYANGGVQPATSGGTVNDYAHFGVFLDAGSTPEHEAISGPNGLSTVNERSNVTFSTVLSLSAGSHTLRLKYKKEGTLTLGLYDFSIGYAIIRAAAANYNKAENIPIPSYNSTTQVDLVAMAGASSVLRSTLNDGVRRIGTAPISIDFTTTGLGALDTGTVAADTWYYLYLVPNASGSGLSAVASVSNPSTGPTGYPYWKYCGFARTNSSSQIKLFDYRAQGIYRCRSAVDTDNVVYSETAGTPATGAWVNITLTNAVPTAVAGAVLLEGYLDSDAAGLHHLFVEPGNPPAFTPSGASDRGTEFLAQGEEAHSLNSKIITLFDGTLSYFWETRTGAVDLKLVIREIYDKYLTSHSEVQLQAKSPLTTKGDIYTHGTEEARLPVGSDNQVLTADSTEPEGVKWGDKAFYTFEDNFNDSSLNAIWTPTAPGSSTVVEGADGVTLTCSGDDDPYITMALPAGMTNRNWLAQVHLTLDWTGSPGDAAAHFLRINGYGGGVSGKFMRSGVRYFTSDGYHLRVSDGGANEDSASSVASSIWLRIRKFGDEIRTDYYEGAATVDVDGEGRWVENDSAKTWYVVPKSATYDYPITYTELVLQATQSSTNPGAIAIYRKFKLLVF